MPKPFEMGHLEEIKAALERRAQRQQQAEAAHKEFVETSGASYQETSVNQAQPSDSVTYAELDLNSLPACPFKKTSADDSIIYSEILGGSKEEKIKSQIAILKDQKKKCLVELTQAIDKNEKNAIHAYRSELSAIEVSMATKINYLERNKTPSLEQSEELYKSNEPEIHEKIDFATVTVTKDGTHGITFENQPEAEEHQTQEVSLAQEDTHLQGPPVDRTKKPGISSKAEPIEKRKNKDASEKRVHSTKSTLERDDSKEQENLLSNQPSKAAKPTPATTSLQTRLQEFCTIWSDPVPSVDSAPPVDRKLKPPRLVQSDLLSSPNFFSEDQSDQKAKKEKATGSFAYRQ